MKLIATPATRTTPKDPFAPGLNLCGLSSTLYQYQTLNDYRSLNSDIRLPLDKQDIEAFLWPDAENAKLMNKAYLTIVREQSYTKGRDATVSPLIYLRQQFEEGEKTGIEIPLEPQR